MLKISFLLASWRSMTKIAGSGSESGSGSTRQRHGSADPDPPQNFMDPEHCFNAIHHSINESINQLDVSGSHPPALPGLCGSGGRGYGEAWILSLSCNCFTKMLTVNQIMTLSINQVYRDPIPLHCLGCVDLADEEAVKPWILSSSCNSLLKCFPSIN